MTPSKVDVVALLEISFPDREVGVSPSVYLGNAELAFDFYFKNWSSE